MKQHSIIIRRLLFLLISLLPLSLWMGCTTFYGAVASDHHDAMRQTIHELPLNQVYTLIDGDYILVTRQDGEVWAGVYQSSITNSHILLKRSRGERILEVDRIEWDMINHVYRVERKKNNTVRGILVTSGLLLDAFAFSIGTVLFLALSAIGNLS